MKTLVLLVLLIVQQVLVYAQISNSDASVKLTSPIFIEEVLGKPLSPTANNDISGSPFIYEKWKSATIKLKDGREFENVSIRINILNQTVHYLSSNGKEYVAANGIVSEIQLLDTAINGDLKTHIYRNGFTSIDNNNENTFYEIIAEGKAELLLYKKVKLTETESLGTNVPDRQYAPVQEYYVYVADTMNKCKKSSSFFSNLFDDKKDLVTQYIDQQHLKFKSENDLKLVVDYYNSL